MANIEKIKKDWPGLDNETRASIIYALQRSSQGMPAEFRDFLREKRPLSELMEINEFIRPVSEAPLDVEGRMIVKNFANDPEGAIKFLEDQNPEMEGRIYWRNGRIMGSKEGEQVDRVLDPSTMTFSETLSDVGDNLYGMLDAVITTLAAKGTWGVGAVPAGAAMEAGRQWLGQKFGIEQDIDPWDVTTSGVASIGGKPAGYIAKQGTKGLMATRKAIDEALDEAVPRIAKGTTNAATGWLWTAPGEAAGKQAKALIDFARKTPNQSKVKNRSATEIQDMLMGKKRMSEMRAPVPDPLPARAADKGTQGAYHYMMSRYFDPENYYYRGNNPIHVEENFGRGASVPPFMR